MERKPGVNLGPYELVSAIGKGGMGEVWKARDPRLNRDVAIKVSTARFSERFEREAKAIATLNHPNICQIYDVGPDYLVMEYIEGTSPHGPLSPPEVVHLALGIAAALEAAHNKGITHRDLKPANVLVTQSGPKLLDFGLALVAEQPGSDIADATTTLNVAGAVMGTVAYMSPEQAQGKTVDARSDIFSFGLLLYELLSGRQAFAGNSAVETMTAIIREEPAPLDAPAILSGIVSRCLRKAPAARFQSMNAVRAALEQISAARTDDAPSIAVLPFANMSADKENEYFSDGLAEEILNALAQIHGLKVIARTSSFAFRGKEQDITKIAETLRVKTILEGSVRRAGNRIRVMTQLINATDGSHIWSERYDRELADVFALQDEIAAEVVEALQVKLIGERAARLYQPNLRAYDLFLRGRHELSRFTSDSAARAREYLEQAIALDPGYSEPYAELGQYYYLRAASGMDRAGESMAAARVQAHKALELNAADPRAHALLCAVASLCDHDWNEAERQFRLALAPEPVLPTIRSRCAIAYLLPLGRFQEALIQIERALKQDPLSVATRGFLVWTLMSAALYDRALAEAEKCLQIHGNHWFAIFAKILTLVQTGDLAVARLVAEKAEQEWPWGAAFVGLLAGILAQLGEAGRTGELLAKLREMAPSGLFWYHLVCSEIDAAAECYAKMIERCDVEATLLAAAGPLNPLRSSPRWPALAGMMNLPADTVSLRLHAG